MLPTGLGSIGQHPSYLSGILARAVLRESASENTVDERGLCATRSAKE
jgi:hypothetical protein